MIEIGGKIVYFFIMVRLLELLVVVGVGVVLDELEDN